MKNAKIDEKVRQDLEKQGYRLVGKHSAIKICEWTRKAIRGDDFCYKQQFYGIKSHRCVQMSCSLINCQNTCLHCWRDLRYTIPMTVADADSPKKIIDDCIKEHKKILQGFLGNKKIDRAKFFEALNPKHFAISLTGEATLYPRLADFIKELRKREITSFLVTNGLLPKKLLELKDKKALPTQLYVSLNYPNENLFRKLTRNKEKDAWKNLIQSLELLHKLKTRTVVRITLIKGFNDFNLEEYTKLIKIAKPKFIEVKAYMHVGYSTERLKEENMPLHSEVKDFAKKLSKLINYKILDEKENSRVVLLGKSEKGRMLKLKD